MENVIGLVMAAGTDDRMKSKKSKLAQELYGKAVIKRVVDSMKKAGIEDVTVIVGENRDEIEGILKDEVTYLEQKGCLGTGHAIMQATSYLESKTGRVVIANGNIPLITPETIKELVEKSEKENEAVTILTGIISEPTGYGRVIRENNRITEIIEEKELTEEELLRRIIEYKKYKEITKTLRECLENNSKKVFKNPEVIELPKQKLEATYTKEMISEMYKSIIEKNAQKLNQNAKNIEKIALVDNYTFESKVGGMFK